MQKTITKISLLGYLNQDHLCANHVPLTTQLHPLHVPLVTQG